MTAIAMIPEAGATRTVQEISADIKTTLGIDCVPTLDTVMAAKPAYLEANWHQGTAVMVAPGNRDRLTTESIAVAVSAVNGCDD
jgi:hypothetical protein